MARNRAALHGHGVAESWSWVESARPDTSSTASAPRGGQRRRRVKNRDREKVRAANAAEQIAVGQWTDNCGEAVLAEQLPISANGGESQDLVASAAFDGDETQLGPDGYLYEIFYPTPGAPDDNDEDQTCCSTATGGLSSAVETSSSESEHEQSVPDSDFSAAGELARMIGEMHSERLAQFPARVQLFDAVRSAVSRALGDHFDRMALVGSTALRIDTSASDLDAVVFTRKSASDEAGATTAPIDRPEDVLRSIVQALSVEAPSLRADLIVSTKIPLLIIWSNDGTLSLDLTVNQTLAEWHVLWFQSLTCGKGLAPLFRVPAPAVNTGEAGFVESALRCVKWWLRKRRLPVAKEGGFPSIVWSLMVLHVLRCSLLCLNDEEMQGPALGRALLGALGAFFDRFAEQGMAGTLHFAGAGGTRAEFWPATGSVLASQQFSVLDPTSPDGASAAEAELAPWVSPATRLLHAYELRRGQFLSALALASSNIAMGGADVMRDLFVEVESVNNLGPNTLPAVFSGSLAEAAKSEKCGVLFLDEVGLQLGIPRQIWARQGWEAPFLHRRDNRSVVRVRRCEVHRETGAVWAGSRDQDFRPRDFVCFVSLERRLNYFGAQGSTFLSLDHEAFLRWSTMQDCVSASVQ